MVTVQPFATEVWSSAFRRLREQKTPPEGGTPNRKLPIDGFSCKRLKCYKRINTNGREKGEGEGKETRKYRMQKPE